MSIRPGQRLIQLAAVLGALCLLVFFWHALLWILLIAVLVVGGFCYRDFREARDQLRQLQVSRTLPAVVGRNLPFDHQLLVTYSGSKPVAGSVRDVMPVECEPVWAVSDFELHSGANKQNCLTECRIPVRGLHQFGPIWVRVAGPMGLMDVQQSVDSSGQVKVLPETFASRDELQKDLGAQLLQLDKISRTRQLGAGTEFVSLFPYRYGDDPRRIDWRATARHHSPIVRRFQVELHRDVMIMIDSGRLMGAATDRGSKLDCAIDSALNLARVTLHGGDRCGIGVFDSTLRSFVPPVAGPRSLNTLVDCVYDQQTLWSETDFTRMYAEIQHRQGKRSLLIVISDLGDAETSKPHCAALRRLSQRHLVLFAALRTPVLRKIIHSETDSLEFGSRQAVAMGLERDRSRAINTLKHQGIHVLDVEPQQLTLPLINRFIELRQGVLL